MNGREFAFIASRAMAVYLFIGMLHTMPINIGGAITLQNADQKAWVFTVLLGLIPLLYAALALFLWVKAGWLAGRMVGTTPVGEGGQLDAVSLVQAGVSLIGVYVLSEVFPKAVQAIMLVLMAYQSDIGMSVLIRSMAASWVSLGVQLVLGVCLMFGAASLARLIGWARMAGVAKTPRERAE